ncbi:MAG: hypothetical protein ABIG68_03510 [Acidobacteriota bacterium]
MTSVDLEKVTWPLISTDEHKDSLCEIREIRGQAIFSQVPWLRGEEDIGSKIARLDTFRFVPYHFMHTCAMLG